jgi:hypothetical protein
MSRLQFTGPCRHTPQHVLSVSTPFPLFPFLPSSPPPHSPLNYFRYFPSVTICHILYFLFFFFFSNHKNTCSSPLGLDPLFFILKIFRVYLSTLSLVIPFQLTLPPPRAYIHYYRHQFSRPIQCHFIISRTQQTSAIRVIPIPNSNSATSPHPRVCLPRVFPFLHHAIIAPPSV